MRTRALVLAALVVSLAPVFADGDEGAVQGTVQSAAAALGDRLKTFTFPGDAVSRDGRVRVRLALRNATDGRVDPEKVLALVKKELTSRAANVVLLGPEETSSEGYLVRCQISSSVVSPGRVWYTAALEVAHMGRRELDLVVVRDGLAADGKLAKPGSPELAKLEDELGSAIKLGPREVRETGETFRAALAKAEVPATRLEVAVPVNESGSHLDVSRLVPALEAAALESGKVHVLVTDPGFLAELRGERASADLVLASKVTGDASLKVELVLTREKTVVLQAEKALGVEPPPRAAVVAGNVLSIEAKVAALKGKVVLLSVGSDDKVEKGYTFFVYRGTTAIGKVVVEEVLRDSSNARIVSVEVGKRIETGDSVTSLPADGLAKALDAAFTAAAQALRVEIEKLELDPDEKKATRPAKLAVESGWAWSRARIAVAGPRAVEVCTKVLGASPRVTFVDHKAARFRVEHGIHELRGRDGASALYYVVELATFGKHTLVGAAADVVVVGEGAVFAPGPSPADLKAVVDELREKVSRLDLPAAERAGKRFQRLVARVKSECESEALGALVRVVLVETGKVACVEEGEADLEVSVKEGVGLTVAVVRDGKTILKVERVVGKK